MLDANLCPHKGRNYCKACACVRASDCETEGMAGSMEPVVKEAQQNNADVCMHTRQTHAKSRPGERALTPPAETLVVRMSVQAER